MNPNTIGFLGLVLIVLNISTICAFFLGKQEGLKKGDSYSVGVRFFADRNDSSPQVTFIAHKLERNSMQTSPDMGFQPSKIEVFRY